MSAKPQLAEPNTAEIALESGRQFVQHVKGLKPQRRALLQTLGNDAFARYSKLRTASEPRGDTRIECRWNAESWQTTIKGLVRDLGEFGEVMQNVCKDAEAGTYSAGEAMPLDSCTVGTVLEKFFRGKSASTAVLLKNLSDFYKLPN